MKKKIMVICDEEVEYAQRFQDYLSRKASFSFQVQIFTTKEQLIIFSKRNEIEILILAENFYDEQINEIKTNHMVILSETNRFHQDEFFLIPKYQSSEKIIREILYYYQKLDSTFGSTRIRTKNTKLIGVYTPIGRCLQTSFSLLLGQLLSKKNKVLYLNFEAFSGFGKFMNRDFQSDIIDVMYLLNQMQTNFDARFFHMIQNVNGLDYIPPAFSFLDLTLVTEEKWIEFLKYIEEKDSYDYVILDLSDNIQGLLSILQKCNVIYTLTKEDGISMAKIDQYEKLLNTLEYQDIIERTKHFRFPQFKNIPIDIEQLPFCELAKYVKAIMKEDLHEELSNL